MAKTRLPFMTAELVKSRSGAMCEARIPDARCQRHGGNLHHRRFRSGGEDHSPANLLDICGNCHDWIHGHKRAAMAEGWAISSHSSTPPEEVQVSYRGRPALLHPRGFVQFVIGVKARA